MIARIGFHLKLECIQNRLSISIVSKIKLVLATIVCCHELVAVFELQAEYEQ